MLRPGVPRPYGGAAAPRRSPSSLASTGCLVAFVVILGIVWYSVTVAILSGCDGAPPPDSTSSTQPGRSLMRIGAVAMSGIRKSLGGAGGGAAAGAAAGGQAAAGTPAAALQPETLANPRVQALTRRLLRVLRKEGQPGASADADADFESVARSLAAAVVAAEAGGAVAAGEDDEHEAAAAAAAVAAAAAAAAAAATAAAKQSCDDSKQAAGAAATAADPDAPPPEFTQQTCYLQTDESEICVYDGVLCYDGKSPVVAVANPVRTPERIVDYTHYCSDFRYYEPSAMEYSGCAYKHPFERNYKYEWPMLPATDFPLPLTRRRWGPQNRNGHLYFKEVSPEEIWGAPAANQAGGSGGVRDLRSAGNPGVDGPVAPPFATSPSGAYVSTLVTAEPFAFSSNASSAAARLRVERRTRVGNRTIDWVDGLWLAGIDGQFWQNPYHWWSKIGVLYDALRANATPGFLAHPADGWLQHRQAGEITAGPGSITRKLQTQNRMTFKQGPQWDLPRMDTVLFTGDGAVVLDGVHRLQPWFKGTLDLATQPHTDKFFNEVLGELSDHRLLCTTRGAIPGVKNKIFTGRADAWLWRHYAYKAMGLGAKGYRSHPRYPPRKVTIIDRKGLNGRGIYNKQELIDAVAATGLPYEVVPNMASLSFAAQVELIAGTGILIAPHGAHLTNSMFLPVHAVVIELFPYLLKKNTYKHLASLADLHYFPIYSWELLPARLNTTFYGVALMQEKYYWEHCVSTNITSYEALMEHACNAMSKNYPIVVPFPQFSMTLKDAIDSIGAYSLQNPEWAALAEKEGVPVTPAPDSAKQLDRFGIFG